MTPGQAAFIKWYELFGRFTPRRGPNTWEEFSDETRAKWEEVALEAINQHIDDGLPEVAPDGP